MVGISVLDLFQMYSLDGVGGGNLGKCQAAGRDVQPGRFPKPGRSGITDWVVGAQSRPATRESKMIRRFSAAPAAVSRECSSGAAGVDRDVRSTTAFRAKHDLSIG